MDWDDFKKSRTMACLKGLGGAVTTVQRVQPEAFNDDRLAILVATTGCVVGMAMNELGKGDQIDSATSDFTLAIDGLISDVQDDVRTFLPDAIGNSLFGSPDIILMK